MSSNLLITSIRMREQRGRRMDSGLRSNPAGAGIGTSMWWVLRPDVRDLATSPLRVSNPIDPTYGKTTVTALQITQKEKRI